MWYKTKKEEEDFVDDSIQSVPNHDQIGIGHSIDEGSFGISIKYCVCTSIVHISQNNGKICFQMKVSLILFQSLNVMKIGLECFTTTSTSRTARKDLKVVQSVPTGQAAYSQH